MRGLRIPMSARRILRTLYQHVCVNSTTGHVMNINDLLEIKYADSGDEKVRPFYENWMRVQHGVTLSDQNKRDLLLAQMRQYVGMKSWILNM